MGELREVRARPARIVRALVLGASAAALALVALPTVASADFRVPPPACPPEVSLQGIERAPGGVIFGGTVVAATPDVGRVRIVVDSWYHRSAVPGLAPGDLPPTMQVLLGPRQSLSGRAAVARLPAVGTTLLVAGTWAGGLADVSIACGVFADTATGIGRAWAERAEARYGAAAPTAPAEPGRFPVEAPWFLLGAGAALALLAAMILGALAQARDPAPAV